MLTQPLMYKRIKTHPNVLTIYTEKLLREGVITEAIAKEVHTDLITIPYIDKFLVVRSISHYFYFSYYLSRKLKNILTTAKQSSKRRKL